MPIFKSTRSTARYGNGTSVIGGKYGLLSISHETYPKDIKDPRTGFTIKAGDNLILHAARIKPTPNVLATVVLDLCQIANMVAEWPQDSQPDKIISATHLNIARIAMRFGFRRLLPDQRIIAPYFVELLDEAKSYLQSNKVGVNIDPDPNVHVIFMPTGDFLNVYGSGQVPTQQAISDLSKVARAESRNIEKSARKR